MITILAVGPEAEALAAYCATHPSVEVVSAHGAEDALERLARNRRIDAVLLLDADDARETARLITEEDPAGPPVFSARQGAGEEGLRTIEAGSPAAMLDGVVRALAG